MAKHLLKKLWQASPQSARHMLCAGLCLLAAQKRGQAPDATDPLYICAPFGNNSGMGRGGRLYAAECRRQGRDCHLVDITEAMLMSRTIAPEEGILPISALAKHVGPGHVVIHANPPQYQFAISALGKPFLRGKHVTAYWSWELELLPPVWNHAFAYADSIETPSAFVQSVIQQKTNLPVRLRPHLYPPPTKIKDSWSEDGILRCLYIFDAGSTYARKNPFGALRAFAKAFKAGEAKLTFKISNPAADIQSCHKLEDACANVPGARVLIADMNEQELESLYLDHDLYISLHRSEGFGLTIFEALRLGLYAVATGWSGNMDFMNSERAFAVPCSLVPICQGSGAFKSIPARWAEPDIDAAAEILRDLRKRILKI